jgi:hypothetical protein
MNYYDILLAKKLEDDRDPRVEGLSVTENGRYEEDGVVYKPVIVSVAPPEDSYQLKSITTPTSLATFEASAMPMPKLKVSVEAKQDLHGYDHPWVGGAGKNKLNTNYVVSHLTSNNVDIVKNDDGSLDVTINGSCSGTVNYLFKQTDAGSGLKAGSYKAILIADGTYTGNIQLTIGGGTSEVSYRMAALNTTTEVFTISNDDNTLHYCLLQFATGATVTGKLKIYPMICSANEDMTTWSPYSNICPISGWDEANVSDVDDVDNPTVTQTTTISLPQTVYGGELDVVNGGGTEGYGFEEFNSSDGFLQSSAYPNVFDKLLINKIAPISDNAQSTTCICNQALVWEASGDAIANRHYISIQRNNSNADGYISIRIDGTTLNDLNDYLQANPVQFKYPLATPTTFETQPTPIKSLEGTNNLSVDCGDVIEGEYFIAL